MEPSRALCPRHTQDITAHTHRTGVSLLGPQGLGSRPRAWLWGQLQRGGQRHPHCASLPPPGADEMGDLESTLVWASATGTFLLQGWLYRCRMLVSRAPLLRQALGSWVRAGGRSEAPSLLPCIPLKPCSSH